MIKPIKILLGETKKFAFMISWLLKYRAEFIKDNGRLINDQEAEVGIVLAERAWERRHLRLVK